MTKITPARRRLSIALWASAIAAAVLVAGLALLRPDHVPAGQAVYRGDADIRSEFSLLDHNGQVVSQKDYAGRWQLVFLASPTAQISVQPPWHIWVTCWNCWALKLMRLLRSS